jgi:flagellar basal body-associated protein FliL
MRLQKKKKRLIILAIIVIVILIAVPITSFAMGQMMFKSPVEQEIEVQHLQVQEMLLITYLP